MSKKFKEQAARPSVYSTLSGYTQEELEILTAPNTPTAQEVQEMRETFTTQGHKGAKIQRINMGFTPSNIAFIRTMAKVKGQTMTEFVNDIITKERENNSDTYAKLQELLKDL